MVHVDLAWCVEELMSKIFKNIVDGDSTDEGIA